jgi:hypothetical protein
MGVSVKTFRKHRQKGEHRCRFCKKWKPHNEKHFYRNPQARVGFSMICRPCYMIDRRERQTVILGTCQWCECERKRLVTLPDGRKVCRKQCAGEAVR